MMENGFSSPRSEAFPAGLRVLVVDDDPTWLKILEKMLRKCSYEVTTCGLARDALKMLRERKDGYDIVISDVNMPDMDGFKLLEHVGLEMDLPVIMMSVDGETSRVMKGVQHGACDYLLKPIRMKELRNIWQHVVRKKILEVRDIESFEGIESIQMSRNGSDMSDDGHLLCGEDVISQRKRKDAEKKHDDKEFADNNYAKKARVVWSVDLHQKFVKAVDQIGFDKVGPKKILDLMNVPWLTRENVASHLQKYRLYLSRLQEEDDIKSSCRGVKHSESPTGDSSGSIGIRKMISLQHSDVPNSTYVFSGHTKIVQNVDSRSHEIDRKGIGSIPVSDSKQASTIDVRIASTIDVRDPYKPRISQIGHSLRSGELGLNFAACDRMFPSPYLWCEIPEIQLKQEQPCVNDGLKEPPLPGQQQHMQDDYIQAALPAGSGLSTEGRPMSGHEKIKASYECRSNVNHVSSTGFTLNSSPLQVSTRVVNDQAIKSIPTNTSNGKRSDLDLSCITKMESGPEHINWGPSVTSLDNQYNKKVNLVTSTGSALDSNHSQTSFFMPNYLTDEPIYSQAPSIKNQVFNVSCISDLEVPQSCVDCVGITSDELRVCWVQDDCCAMNLGLQNIDFSEYCDPGLVGEVPIHLYDALKFDYGNSSDSTDYSVIDQSLFIA